MASKSKSQMIHARRRAKERHGIDLTLADQNETISKIQDGKATFLKRQSNRLTRWLVEVKGQELDIIYDSNRHTLVTILPKETNGRN